MASIATMGYVGHTHQYSGGRTGEAVGDALHHYHSSAFGPTGEPIWDGDSHTHLTGGSPTETVEFLICENEVISGESELVDTSGLQENLDAEPIEEFSMVSGEARVTYPDVMIYEVDSSEVNADGGDPIVLRGFFEVGVPYLIYIGNQMSSAGERAHSGKAGRPASISTDGITLATFTPSLDVGTHGIYVVPEGGGKDAYLLDAITVRKSSYRSGQFSINSVFSPIWEVGPRSIDRVGT